MPRSTRKTQVAAARERRLARLRRREAMLDDVAKGVHYNVIASRYEISERTVRREVGRALDQHTIDPPRRHIRLQIARLTDALRLIDDAMLEGHLGAIDPLLKVLDRLDRYNALGQPKPEPEKPPVLALTHRGQKLAPIALKSPAPDLSAPLAQAPHPETEP